MTRALLLAAVAAIALSQPAWAQRENDDDWVVDTVSMTPPPEPSTSSIEITPSTPTIDTTLGVEYCGLRLGARKDDVHRVLDAGGIRGLTRYASGNELTLWTDSDDENLPAVGLSEDGDTVRPFKIRLWFKSGKVVRIAVESEAYPWLGDDELVNFVYAATYRLTTEFGDATGTDFNERKMMNLKVGRTMTIATFVDYDTASKGRRGKRLGQAQLQLNRLAEGYQVRINYTQ